MQEHNLFSRIIRFFATFVAVFFITFGISYANDVYTIKYLNEDNVAIITDNPTVWTVGETEAFTLAEAVMDGYKFNGWYKENVMYTENVTGTRLTEITEEYIVANADENKVVTIYGQLYPEPVFWVTTTPDTDFFRFYQQGCGTYYVEWGDGHVNKANFGGPHYFAHNYATAGSYKIGMSGTARAYDYCNNDISNDGIAAQGIGYPNIHLGMCWGNGGRATGLKVAGVSGSLGKLYPTLDISDNPYDNQPDFGDVFCGCTNLTGEIPVGFFDGVHGQPRGVMFKGTFAQTGIEKIPENLFGGLNGVYKPGIFAQTFLECTKLQELPKNIFGGLYGSPVEYMFYQTFTQCTDLKGAISENFFGDIYGKPAPYMFTNTFFGCDDLTGTIPDGLFGDINGAPTEYMFRGTFYGCSGLTGAIPERLFGTFTDKPALQMFYQTFAGCSGLGTNISEADKPEYMKQGYAIPPNLFSGVNGAPADYMYTGTFGDCSGLGGKIPENLFGNISGAPAQYMYNGTFYNCSGLIGPIPNKLFGTFNNIPAQYMFSKTFDGCTSLEGPIPDDLFNGITGQIADYSFNKTFQNCSSLTGEIPENLFAGITGTAKWGFYNTFNGATKLGLKEDGSSSPIPSGLFKDISGEANSANQMFNGTFANTGYLTSYVPVDLFKNVNGFLADNQIGTRLSTYIAGGMTNIFDNSAVSTVCPSGMYQYLTGFEVDWSGRVACEQCPSEFPKSDMGQNVSITSCYTDCPEITGKTLTGGKKYWTADLVGNTETCVYDGIAYNINYELNGGVNYEGAPTSYVYAIGAMIGGTPTKNSFAFISWCRDAELTDCAMPYKIGATDSGDITLYAKWQFICETDKWFHIGEERMCLYSNKETEKTINFDIGGDVYYLLMSINPDLRINATSTKKLRMKQNGVIYNGHDWSVM